MLSFSLLILWWFSTLQFSRYWRAIRHFQPLFRRYARLMPHTPPHQMPSIPYNYILLHAFQLRAARDGFSIHYLFFRLAAATLMRITFDADTVNAYDFSSAALRLADFHHFSCLSNVLILPQCKSSQNMLHTISPPLGEELLISPQFHIYFLFKAFHFTGRAFKFSLS